MKKTKYTLGIVILSLILLLTLIGCSSNPFSSDDDDGIKGHVTMLNSEIDEDEFNVPSTETQEATISSAADYQSEGEYVEDEVIVRFKDSAEIDELLNNYGLSLKNEIESLGVKLLKIEKDSYDLEELIAELEAEAEVEYAEPNWIAYISADEKHPENEEHYDKQWHYSAISLPYAWDITTGSDDVTVAVLDTGVDAEHPDLEELVIDGKNFTVDEDDEDRNNPYDTDGHGTHVAGTIGAAANNEGVVGVNWNVQIMPVKVLGDDGGGSNFDIAKGIEWATKNGADIINMSLGSVPIPIPSKSQEDAINYAYNNGVTVIAASGNDENPEVTYPARYDNAIAVGSVDHEFDLSDFSNYGREIDFVAPGSNVFSTLPNEQYEIESGTSMAAPHVAGVAALILAENPNLNPDHVKEHLKLTAQNLGDRGWDFKYGHGVINAYAAVADLKISEAVVFAGKENGDQIEVKSELVKVTDDGFYSLPDLDDKYYLYAWIDKDDNDDEVSAGDYFGKTSSKVGSGVDANISMELVKDKEIEIQN
ncbi:S8 family peptidase [Fuchsiella alkaliacetigena]|uniref:S8 family peptidase n=1 Tax=Fuchsiella alkaliacetigena TaxID=957042 RepID=UPI00200B5824|nr:S8 family peptidase [Fuchsiella alkaliacetigena]MCK8825834.1 S8 family peptidase [Fuchsiella alkaliacetigena]